jgi:hypothetical protein
MNVVSRDIVNGSLMCAKMATLKTHLRRDYQYLKALDDNFSKFSALSLYFVLKLSWEFGKYAYLFVSLFLNSYELS